MSAKELTASWRGEAPRVGHYLKAPRGRTAYEIAAIRPIKRTTGTGGRTLVQRFKLTVVRHSPSDVPEGATIHVWNWDKRRRRRA